MDEPTDFHTLVKSVRQKKINIIYHLHVESKVIQMNLFIKQKQTHRHKKQTNSRGDKFRVWD